MLQLFWSNLVLKDLTAITSSFVIDRLLFTLHAQNYYQSIWTWDMIFWHFSLQQGAVQWQQWAPFNISPTGNCLQSHYMLVQMKSSFLSSCQETIPHPCLHFNHCLFLSTYSWQGISSCYVSPTLTKGFPFFCPNQQMENCLWK